MRINLRMNEQTHNATEWQYLDILDGRVGGAEWSNKDLADQLKAKGLHALVYLSPSLVGSSHLAEYLLSFFRRCLSDCWHLSVAGYNGRLFK